MAKVRRRGPSPEGFQMAPMIDMVFLLLVFFMCVSTLADAERAKAVDLPESTRSKVSEDLSDRGMVTLDAEGKIYLGARELTVDEVSESVRELAERKPGLRLVIRADKATPFGEVKKALLAIAEGGVSDIVYSTFEAKG